MRRGDCARVRRRIPARLTGPLSVPAELKMGVLREKESRESMERKLQEEQKLRGGSRKRRSLHAVVGVQVSCERCSMLW